MFVRKTSAERTSRSSDVAGFRPLEVQHQALLVATVEDPVVIPVAHGAAGQPVQAAVGVALGGLDLDDLGAEVPHHRRRGRPRDVAADIQHPDPRQNHPVLLSSPRREAIEMR